MLVPKIQVAELPTVFVYCKYAPNNKHGSPENTTVEKEKHRPKPPMFGFQSFQPFVFEGFLYFQAWGHKPTKIIHKTKLRSGKTPSLMEDKVLANLNKSSASHTFVQTNNGEWKLNKETVSHRDLRRGAPDFVGKYFCIIPIIPPGRLKWWVLRMWQEKTPLIPHPVDFHGFLHKIQKLKMMISKGISHF